MRPRPTTGPVHRRGIRHPSWERRAPAVQHNQELGSWFRKIALPKDFSVLSRTDHKVVLKPCPSIEVFFSDPERRAVAHPQLGQPQVSDS